MLDDETVKNLKSAITALAGPQSSTMPTHTLDALQQLAASGMAFTIDMSASQSLGGPVILAQPANSDAPLDQVWLKALTPRQQEVAKSILNGHSNKQIARDLAISPATVKDHVHAILTKLALSSRAELIATHYHHKPR